MASGIYEQALKAYTNAYQMGSGDFTLLNRAKCNLALCNISEAKNDIKTIYRANKNYLSDYVVLKILNNVKTNSIKDKNIKELNELITNFKEIKNEESGALIFGLSPEYEAELGSGHIFLKEDIIIYRGIFKIYLKEYEDAIKVY